MHQKQPPAKVATAVGPASSAPAGAERNARRARAESRRIVRALGMGRSQRWHPLGCLTGGRVSVRAADLGNGLALLQQDLRLT